MDSAYKIRKLCEQIIACEDEGRCIDMLEELRTELHNYIETIRGKVIVFPMSDSDFDVEDEPDPAASAR